MKKFNYDDYVNECKLVAQIIWDNAFFTGFRKLKKSQLYLVIDKLAERLNSLLDADFYERDVKCICFDEKCLIIETLDENFFNEGNK